MVVVEVAVEEVVGQKKARGQVDSASAVASVLDVNEHVSELFPVFVVSQVVWDRRAIVGCGLLRGVGVEHSTGAGLDSAARKHNQAPLTPPEKVIWPPWASWVVGDAVMVICAFACDVWRVEEVREPPETIPGHAPETPLLASSAVVRVMPIHVVLAAHRALHSTRVPDQLSKLSAAFVVMVYAWAVVGGDQDDAAVMRRSVIMLPLASVLLLQ